MTRATTNIVTIWKTTIMTKIARPRTTGRPKTITILRDPGPEETICSALFKQRQH